MPTYVFKGRNRLNEVVVGERVADNREALRQILRREQVTLTSVKEKGREIGIPKIGGVVRFRMICSAVDVLGIATDRRDGGAATRWAGESCKRSLHYFRIGYAFLI